MVTSATDERDLRTGMTIWQAAPRPSLRVSALTSAISTDVVVVGAGISGALIAERLAATGFRVVIVDRRGPCRGSTAASTSLIQFEIDTPLLHLREKIGAENAARAWIRSAATVEELIQHARRLRIGCDLASRATLYLAGDVLGARDLQREVELRSDLGLPSCYLDRASLQKRVGIDRRGAILSAANAEADPIRLTAGFLRRAIRLGARLHAPVDVIHVRSRPRGIEVQTREGATLRCRFFVYATGYELAEDLPAEGHSIHSTWAIATKPQPENLWPTRDLIWEASDPYLYLRTTPDGRVIVGGEDEDFEDDEKRDSLIASKSERLQKQLAKLMPSLEPSAEFRWAACFGSSETGLPTIGEVPGMARCYAALGYGGNGITFSMLAARLIQRSISGAGDPDSDLFAFH
jgi:glycine/D-amino acid oxidase-like deaminating enzyme